MLPGVSRSMPSNFFGKISKKFEGFKVFLVCHQPLQDSSGACKIRSDWSVDLTTCLCNFVQTQNHHVEDKHMIII
jgi:hypothetical protein